ncbi:EF-hand calcium-binding domain-containing protein 3-like [Pteropus vampyrus]|uniref:EF-hand calcium-binding domain-containing protein 3-like n=1 Tax=Pteropus vampyrus TaxID=132908 RepID=A0A6P3RKH4_PTEVA|nr:EF-hand calcium-binding domain-containing protein 3-like [Pteropus vampyrus]
MATGVEQTSPKAKEFKGFVATRSVQSGPGAGLQRCKGLSNLFPRGSFADENMLLLTPRQLAAFQDIFKLFSSSPTGTVDMRSMKAALSNVGIQLSPREMCEALQQADLDGDRTVSFKDFLGVLTDSHRLAQCLSQVRNSQGCDQQRLQTLFFEMLFKLMRLGFVPYKSMQEVMSYYSKKQRALRLNSSCKSWSRGQDHSASARVGLTFYCQATRLSGLTSTQLVRSLNRLHKTGAPSPYSQIPNLAEQTLPEHKTRNPVPCSEVRLSKLYRPYRPYRPSHPKPNPKMRSQGFVDQPLENISPWKLASSPPTLVQKQPFSPSPICLQGPAKKNLYK